MTRFRNRHRQQTGLVIGNGPSLKDVPRAFLSKYPSFGTNRIYLLDGFQPTYYVCMDDNVVRQSWEDIVALPGVKFLPMQFGDCPGCVPVKAKCRPGFYGDGKQIYQGFTVTYACLELAYLMGFNTVLLVGVDHRYRITGDPKELQDAPLADIDHFTPRYFQEGEQVYAPNYAKMETYYRMAEDAFRKDGRRIINLTPNTALDIFEKDELDRWL